MKLPEQSESVRCTGAGLPFSIVFGGDRVGVAKQVQSPGGGSGKVGKSCKVTSGPNKGKTGTYTEEEGEGIWCEGDWGGTQCSDANGDTGKCKDAARVPGRFGRVVVFDGNVMRLFA